MRSLKLTKWIWRNKWYFIVGVPVFSFFLAPFPVGLGMIYPITDRLRGHPEGPHGSHPERFAGMWIRDEVVEFDFLGQAFDMMPDGRFVGMIGLTQRRWHFDDGRLFVDSVSRCGNCYRGNVTSEYSVRFDGPDRMVVANRDKTATRGIAGSYRRVEIDDALRSDMERLTNSTDDNQSFKARMVLQVISQVESRRDHVVPTP